MFKSFFIDLNISSVQTNYIFTVNSNDLNTIRLDFRVKDKTELYDLTGKIVRLAIRKPDNTVVFQSGGVTDGPGGLCEVLLSNQASLVPGKHEAEIMIYEGEEAVAVTSTFYYNVKKAAMTNEDVESSSDFPVIATAIAAGEKLKDVDLPAIIAAGEAVVTVKNEIDVAKAGFGTLGAKLQDNETKLTNTNNQLTTTNQTVDKKTMGKVTITEKGAKGDKIADDTAAFQAACDMAKLAVLTKGMEVRVPPGIYRLTDRVYLSKNTKIIMDKGAVLFRDHTAGFFVNGRSGDVFTDYNGNGNITIEGGVLDGNIANRNNSYNAIGLARGQNIIIRDVEIRDVRGAHAIDMNACKDVIIERCRFLGYNTDYTTIGDNASYFREAIQISNHTEEGFNLFGSFDGKPCDNVTVKDCYFGKSDNLPAYPVGVGNHGHVLGSFNSNIFVYNNMFDGLTFAGIRPFKFNDIKMYDNKFSKCEYGIRFSNPDGLGTGGGNPEAGKNIEITGNTFFETKVRDIYIAAWQKDGFVSRVKNIKILNNTSEGLMATTENIFLQFVDDVVVRGNTVDKSYRFVWLAYGANTNIEGNDVKNFTTESVYVIEPDVALQGLGHSRDVFIKGNKMKNGGRTAILVGCALDGFEINDNVIKDVTTETVSTRSAINISTSAKNGRAFNNKVRGTNNKYGIEVTASTSNVQTFNNDLVGTTKPLLNDSVGGFEGTYLYSKNGTRHKLTVSDAGALVITAG